MVPMRMGRGDRRPYAVALAVCAFAAGVALSVDQGLGQHVGHDFHVFWQAGRNFTTGEPLYHDYLPGARQFKYPPFAAFLFQPLGLLPLPVAAVLFSFLNLLLWVAAAYLTRDIVARTFPGRNATALPLIVAVVLSAQFFLDNFHHVQMNAVILVLVLLGLRAYLQREDLAAACWLVTATAIKLTPIFFLAWLVIRGRPRAALAVPALAAACVFVPILVRGPATGVAELVEYYDSFLAGHQRGQVRDYTRGHNIASLVNRTMLPAEARDAEARESAVALERRAQLTYRALWAIVLVTLLATLVLLRLRDAPLSAFELSATFLTSLLLSPITFTAHLVVLLFVFGTFLSVRVGALSPAGRVVAAGLLAPMAATGLSGRDLVGRAVSLYLTTNGVFVITMLLLFVAAVVLAVRWSAGGPEVGSRPTSKRSRDVPAEAGPEARARFG
jgi:hypothetical protein